MLTYYCWHCYGKNRLAAGACEHCGEQIAAPPGTSFDDLLLWALRHPLAERRTAAVQALGKRRVEAASERLRRLVSDPDPYLAAAALEALVQIDGAEPHARLLDSLREDGPPPVRAAARRLQPGQAGDGPA
jgi:HEAT repeat protein